MASIPVTQGATTFAMPSSRQACKPTQMTLAINEYPSVKVLKNETSTSETEFHSHQTLNLGDKL
jgi:hypothetical protein